MDLLSPSTALVLWTTVSATAILIVIVWVVVKLIKAYVKKQNIKKM